ncbi:flap endonuclease Xni [Venatoribacter cucullus]|uniref:flap endonuclease Xni n=1 Tax=Venatoribacter cucullus TaxID=2661630 RepID=UPI0019359942|nr:flap endonuclease Xni [Venatoribacter cucullus]QQD21570.1 flap endonuclease Xni [Oceanospirillaceae bacterium ASx5O]UZK03567.1 flap endonuclease Xni [Venatoribacter cucullus]
MKLLIVDAMNLIRRIYAAAEDAELPLEATRSRCLAAIARNAEQGQATHVAMVFEQKCITWRHQLWPDYKLGRPPMPQPLQDDLEALQRYFRQCGLYCLELSGWEGDDVVASLAVKAAFAGLQVTILSTDKGFCQLVNPRLTVRNHFDRFSWDEAMVEQKFGLKPAQLCDFWALTGDTTNHLPGVPGIGPKTAGHLLDTHGSLDVLLVHYQQCETRVQNALQQHWQNALLTRVLARLRTDVPLGFNLHELRWQPH